MCVRHALERLQGILLAVVGPVGLLFLSNPNSNDYSGTSRHVAISLTIAHHLFMG